MGLVAWFRSWRRKPLAPAIVLTQDEEIEMQMNWADQHAVQVASYLRQICNLHWYLKANDRDIDLLLIPIEQQYFIKRMFCWRDPPLLLGYKYRYVNLKVWIVYTTDGMPYELCDEE